MTDSNRELLKGALEGFAAGDSDAYVGIFAEDVVYHYPGQNPLSGDYRGKEAVLGFIRRITEITGDSFRTEVHDVLGSDDHAAVMSYVSAERHGRRMEWRAIGIYNFQDGRVTEAWVHPLVNQSELDEFLS